MLYWAFYKSTLTLNIIVSFVIALVAMVYGGNFFIVFAVSFMSSGLFAVLFYKEIDCSLEYYFYYNQNISKIKLIVFCFLVNILPSALISMLAHHVASA